MEPGQRRLAAILAADVVGYSRLMAGDESGTLARLGRLRAEVIEPKVAQYQGRIVGSAGDSLLIEFASAVNAVQCAIGAQRALARDNADLPEGRRMEFRMGVNLGDVIAADGTIHGDGVNIAARLEKLAEPGGLCIAHNVLDQVEGKLDLCFDDLGEHEAKNIAKPIRVYRIEIAGQPHAAATAQNSAKSPFRSEKVSIAVLPFDNLSGDPDQSYFSDGVTEDIITELSRFRELQVIARNSSFMFRGKAVAINEVAQRLGVQFVVEGSVRKIGNRVRVTVQLIQAVSSAHVWAERYDRDLTDIFAIQDEITQMVVARIAGHAKSATVHRHRSRPTENLSAYDSYLRARELYGNAESLGQAESFLLKAIELDPSFTLGHALLSIRRIGKYLNNGHRDHLDSALAIGQKAFALDSEEPWANFAVGSALMYRRDLEEAGHYFDRAVALNPNESQFLAMHALLMNFKGRTDIALREIEEALRRDPYVNQWFWGVCGSAQTIAGRYHDAIESFNRMKSPRPWSQCYLAICHLELGQLTEAHACLETFKMSVSGMPPERVIANEPYADATTSKRLIDAMRKAETGNSAKGLVRPD